MEELRGTLSESGNSRYTRPDLAPPLMHFGSQAGLSPREDTLKRKGDLEYKYVWRTVSPPKLHALQHALCVISDSFSDSLEEERPLLVYCHRPDVEFTFTNADSVGGWITVLLTVICSLGNRVAKEEYTHVVKERGASCQPSHPEPPTASLNIPGQSCQPSIHEESQEFIQIT